MKSEKMEIDARIDEISRLLEWAINNSGYCDEEYLNKRIFQLKKDKWKEE